jgi:hypothetical protein
MITAAVVMAVLVMFVQGVRGDEGEIHHPTAVPHSVISDVSYGGMSVEYVRIINDYFYDRFAFSNQELRAVLWIAAELSDMGYSRENIEIQTFYYDDLRHTWLMPVMDIVYFIDSTPFVNLELRQDRASQNVVLTVPGRSAETIVVGAHYDSVFLPGASDNASGTALLLESAWRMLNVDNYYTIQYVFFGAEEMGLFGAQHFVRSLSDEEHENILFLINADVLLEGADLFYMAGYDANVGLGDDPEGHWMRLVYNFSFSEGEFNLGANRITEEWDRIAQDVSSRYDMELIAWPQGTFGPSDHLAFLPYGHTVMFLAGLNAPDDWHGRSHNNSFFYVGTQIMNMMRVVHTPRDNFQYISEAWPGKIDENMRAFSIFLDALLSANYGGNYE